MPTRRRYNDSDWQVVLDCQLEVAMIMCRHAHYGACAIGGEDVIADENGHALTVERIDAISPGVDAGLGAIDSSARDVCLRRCLVYVRLDGGLVLGLSER